MLGQNLLGICDRSSLLSTPPPLPGPSPLSRLGIAHTKWKCSLTTHSFEFQTPGGSLRWKYDTTVQCYQGQHGILTYVLGIPGLVFFALACPLWLAWHLGRNSARLGDPAFLARCGRSYNRTGCIRRRGDGLRSGCWGGPVWHLYWTVID